MNSSDITVYTCITGGKDELLDGQKVHGAEQVAFIDTPHFTKEWKQSMLNNVFADPRRNSRLPKMLAHKYIDTEYSIYIDGNIRILTDPKKLIERYLKDTDLAVCKHPVRDCLYDEAKTCLQMGLDDPEVIIEQAKIYEQNCFARHKGLCECGIIFRRHTPKVEEFNNAWFAEYCRHSRRDQISFPYAVDRVGIRMTAIEDYFIEDSQTHALKQSGDFEIVVHTKNG